MILASLLLMVTLTLPNQLPVPTFEPLASPTPIPTYAGLIGIPTVESYHGDIYKALSTVEAGLESLPENLSNPGLPILPGTQGAELFGYAKWVLSTATAYEVFGVFGVIIVHLAARLLLQFVLASISIVITLVVFVLRALLWVIFKIRALLPI